MPVLFSKLPAWEPRLRQLRLRISKYVNCKPYHSEVVLQVPSRHKSKRLVDIVLGFDTAREYLSKDNPYFGNTVGRVTNRIAGAKFSISDEVYHLSKNEGENHLHGGAKAGQLPLRP